MFSLLAVIFIFIFYLIIKRLCRTIPIVDKGIGNVCGKSAIFKLDSLISNK